LKIDPATGIIKKSISNWSNIETQNQRQKNTKLTHPILASTNEVPEPSATASEIGPEDEEAGSDQCFSKSEMTMRNQNKNPRKGSWERTGGTAKIEQVWTGWSTWHRWDWDRGFSRFVGTGWDCDRGFFRLVGTGWE